MGGQPEVVFCGNSQFLAGVAAGLRRAGRVRVTRLDVPSEQVIAELKLLCPDFVIFERDTADERFAAVLNREYPGLRLVGLDPVRDFLVIFGGRSCVVHRLDDLAGVIAGDC